MKMSNDPSIRQYYREMLLLKSVRKTCIDMRIYDQDDTRAIVR